MDSTTVVVALAYVMIATRSIPERTEELAWVLYGANQLGRLGQSFIGSRQTQSHLPLKK